MADRSMHNAEAPMGLRDHLADESEYSHMVWMTGGSINSPGTTEYTEGDVDASITGGAIMWEDTGDTLRAVSASKPLPVDVTSGSVTINVSDIQIGAVEIKDHDSDVRLDVETVTLKNAAHTQSEAGGHPDLASVKTAIELIDHLTAANSGSKDANTQRVVIATDDVNLAAIKTAIEILDNAISGNEMQVDVVSMPADTFVAEDGALGKGVLIQGDDGTDRHNLQTDASGYLKTIAQANNGVDIGDVDIASIGALEQTTPTFYNLTLTVADTEYIQALPANTRALEFQCRTENDIRYAFETGKVATPTSPYSTLKAGDVWYKENIKSSGSLYAGSSTAGVIVEIETWS